MLHTAKDRMDEHADVLLIKNVCRSCLSLFSQRVEQQKTTHAPAPSEPKREWAGNERSDRSGSADYTAQRGGYRYDTGLF